jgi:DNA-binding transcriptional regulator YbjK
MTIAPTRRERLRSAAVAEIKDGARRLLAAGGPQGISLRAIARDMGMTAPAIYRYFPSLDALVTALATDLFGELRETVVAAQAAAGDDPVAQLLEMARAFRHWSVAHPVEFNLIFGSPVPGVADFEEMCVDYTQPGAQFCRPFLDAMLAQWRRRPYRTPPVEVIEERIGPYVDPIRQIHGEIPIQVAWTFLSGWTRLYGLVSLEVNRHLSWAVTNPEAMFELELAAFVEQLGLTPR